MQAHLRPIADHHTNTTCEFRDIANEGSMGPRELTTWLCWYMCLCAGQAKRIASTKPRLPHEAHVCNANTFALSIRPIAGDHTNSTGEVRDIANQGSMAP